jgi:hypothetical protein
MEETPIERDLRIATELVLIYLNPKCHTNIMDLKAAANLIKESIKEIENV